MQLKKSGSGGDEAPQSDQELVFTNGDVRQVLGKFGAYQSHKVIMLRCCKVIDRQKERCNDTKSAVMNLGAEGKRNYFG